jgi:F-type H+-transporting ATPase subunit delta
MTMVGSQYAQALYSLAKEIDNTEQILQELKILNQVFLQEPDFLRLLSAPNLSKDERLKVVDSSFRDKVHPYVLNTLKLLTEKGYTRSFSDCVKAYTQQYNADNGIVCVTAVAAVALSDAQKDKLQSKLEQVTGKQIQLETRVDESCIGGVRLDYEGKRVDGTVKNRLDSLREQLRNTVL